MKSFNKFFILALFFLATFQACKKDDKQVLFEGGTAPKLTTTLSPTGSLTLLKDDKDKVAATFSWTNPEYRFNTGVSSHNVNYILQVDTAGANFKSSLLQEQSFANNLEVTFTVKELNAFLVKMERAHGVPHNMEMRVKSALVNNSVPLYSNVFKKTIIPYLDFAVEPPGTLANNYTDGNLWIVGDAVASGWSNPLPVPFSETQKFSRTDVLHYVDTLTFNATGAYKLIQIQGDWTQQYHALDGNAKLEGSFEKKDSDPGFPSPGAGSYRVEINFQTGKYKLTKL